MEDPELEAIRQKKLQALQQQQEQESERAQFEEQKKALMRQLLDIKARERLENIRLAKPDVASAVEQQLLALAQSGRVQVPIDDKMFVQILEKLLPQKREIKITRR